jgi:hypothetical protein
MNAPGEADLLVRARSVLLNALEALSEHRGSLVVIGAQAIYLHTGALDLPLAEATKDSDIVVDPRVLAPEPLLEAAMQASGFHRNLTAGQPGSWLSDDDVPVDLMVPAALAGPGGRRGARIPPHDKHATRRAGGLEATVVDHAPMAISALDPQDPRVITTNVAGPAALLVAKLYKLGERKDTPNRLLDKDAHDVYRLLAATDTVVVAKRLNELVLDDLAGPTTVTAVQYLRELFSGPTAVGSVMVGRAEQNAGEPEIATTSVVLLVRDLLEALDPDQV